MRGPTCGSYYGGSIYFQRAAATSCTLLTFSSSRWMPAVLSSSTLAFGSDHWLGTRRSKAGTVISTTLTRRMRRWRICTVGSARWHGPLAPARIGRRSFGGNTRRSTLAAAANTRNPHRMPPRAVDRYRIMRLGECTTDSQSLRSKPFELRGGPVSPAPGTCKCSRHSGRSSRVTWTTRAFDRGQRPKGAVPRREATALTGYHAPAR